MSNELTEKEIYACELAFGGIPYRVRKNKNEPLEYDVDFIRTAERFIEIYNRLNPDDKITNYNI